MKQRGTGQLTIFSNEEGEVEPTFLKEYIAHYRRLSENGSNGLFDNVYNPDVLSCLANLSNDEVFTPPEVVNQMLDALPPRIV